MNLGPIRRRAADAAGRAGLCPACGRGSSGGNGVEPADIAADDALFRGVVGLLWLAGVERRNRRAAARAEPIDEPGLLPLLDGLLCYLHGTEGPAIHGGPATGGGPDRRAGDGTA